MNYQETIAYLYEKLPLFSRIGEAAYKKDLHNTIALCEKIQNPHQKIKTIHIAGTNGKGSVSHMLAAILQQAGYKTGLYTSPHLYDFRERIKINGEMISENAVINFTKAINPWIEEISPSFFEVTVAMAFDYFYKSEVDIAVIETGLGGRLDSTNVINPVLSIITNIGWDHMNLLGNSLEAISYEKAGIIKENTPVVIGKKQEESWPVFTLIAKQKNATVQLASTNCPVKEYKWKENLLEVAIEKENSLHSYQLDLTGVYQVENISTVCCAVDQLRKNGFSISEESLIKGLRNVSTITGFQGRWEKIASNPSVILDVAHNVDGIRQVLRQLEMIDYNHLHIVIGMVKDKEIEKVLSLLPKTATYYFTQAQLPRALPAQDLEASAKKTGLTGFVFNSVNSAIEEAQKNARIDDLILVCGSLFIIGEVDRVKLSL
ncbi:MAG: bifunctional folylpolyglutamate synthase/dihydrofolate synthase [Chitinophagaceae bacterium]|nr:bifunctional folylpolyglutamate synthase/dihydrofolate synthase [Chitinophagia bacterium]NDB52878.1 bifunctional folylpolyglutamate synthase/dihydrofolate synthase [Chitinophagaceae bacterium]